MVCSCIYNVGVTAMISVLWTGFFASVSISIWDNLQVYQFSHMLMLWLWFFKCTLYQIALYHTRSIFMLILISYCCRNWLICWGHIALERIGTIDSHTTLTSKQRILQKLMSKLPPCQCLRAWYHSLSKWRIFGVMFSIVVNPFEAIELNLKLCFILGELIQSVFCFLWSWYCVMWHYLKNL